MNLEDLKGLRIYVAGPMESAGGNWNMPLFDHVAGTLRAAGCEVFNPIDHLRAAHGSLENVLKLNKPAQRRARRRALKNELIWIADHAQALVLLPGWQRSPGATVEHGLALAIDIPVHMIDGTILLDVAAK